MSSSALDAMKASLSRLQSEKEEATRDVCRIGSAIELVEWEIVKEVWGVYVGCLVRTGKDVFMVSGDRVEFLDVLRLGQEKPWLHGYRKKKDGAFEAFARPIYRDWEVIPNE